MTINSSLPFGNTIIEYCIDFAQRKTASIEVHPDQGVMVKAPEGSQLEAIEDLVHKRASWILKQQQKFASYAPQDIPRQYVSGESYRYLGRQYRLKVLERDEPSIRLERSYIYITVPDKRNTKQVQQILEQWYRDAAKAIFQERLSVCYPRIERLGVLYPTLSVRAMKTRWGSCGQSGLIILNPRLVQTPLDCIDYVLLHELCHLKEHNHSKNYYHLLDQILPNWRERREKLNKFELG
ncbi:M48 family metallopeptidase [Ktedonospora formicarum]|nr:SprT family zinc-dependent metalloprotease [Ktedonospora formicarum]